MSIMSDFEETCDLLDAAVFTGDSLVREDNRALLRDYLARWQRELDSMKETFAEDGSDLV